MKIGLIGCGKVGTTIFYLLKKNNRIIGVYDKLRKNQNRAVKLLGIKQNPCFTELCTESEALFFATPDDQIKTAYNKARPFFKGKKVVFHFSGILSSSIFKKEKNISRASVHPFSSFPEITLPPKKKFFIFVEGDKKAVAAARKIFNSKSFVFRKIERRKKSKHHLAGVFSSNLLVALIAAACDLARQAGWNKKDLNDIIFSIIEETLHNVKKKGLRNGLSGPLARGDVKVIKKHLRTLKKEKKLLRVYKALSALIIHNILTPNERKQMSELDF